MKKCMIEINNPEMGITGNLWLDLAAVPEYERLSGDDREVLANNICLAISGTLGWRLFRERFCERHQPRH
jgi:hypothetical protein